MWLLAHTPNRPKSKFAFCPKPKSPQKQNKTFCLESQLPQNRNFSFGSPPPLGAESKFDFGSKTNSPNIEIYDFIITPKSLRTQISLLAQIQHRPTSKFYFRKEMSHQNSEYAFCVKKHLKSKFGCELKPQIGPHRNSTFGQKPNAPSKTKIVLLHLKVKTTPNRILIWGDIYQIHYRPMRGLFIASSRTRYRSQAFRAISLWPILALHYEMAPLRP